MHPGRRDFSGGYRDDFRSYGRNAGMRGGYDDAEEEYDDGSYGYNNGLGMQPSGGGGGGGGQGSEVSNQLNLVAALLAQTLQQQQQQQQQQHQSSQPPMGQRTNVYQSAHSLLGRPPQQQQQQQMQQFSGLMDDWSSGNMSNPRGVGRPGPPRGSGRGRPGILGDGLLPYNGPQQASEVPSLLDMPPLRAGRGLWGGGEPRPGIKRRSDNWNETDSQKRRKEASTGDQNRGAAGSHGTGSKPSTGLTPKDKATPASSAAASAAKTGKSDTPKKPQAPASATPIKGKASIDPQAGKAPVDSIQKAAAPVVKKEAVTAQLQKSDSPLTAEPLVYESGKVYGCDYVVPVTGYFCKLCHKFYSNVTAATVTHCQSEQHFAKYKATLAKKIKSLASTENNTDNASESILDDVPQAVSSSASATNANQPEAEDEESAPVAAAAVDKSANSDPDASCVAEVGPSSEPTAKIAEGDASSANVGELVLGDVGSESAGLDSVSKAGNEADLDASVASSANESIDEIMDESPSTAVRGRRVRGRGSALRRGRK